MSTRRKNYLCFSRYCAQNPPISASGVAGLDIYVHHISLWFSCQNNSVCACVCVCECRLTSATSCLQISRGMQWPKLLLKTQIFASSCSTTGKAGVTTSASRRWDSPSELGPFQLPNAPRMESFWERKHDKAPPSRHRAVCLCPLASQVEIKVSTGERLRRVNTLPTWLPHPLLISPLVSSCSTCPGLPEWVMPIHFHFQEGKS